MVGVCIRRLEMSELPAAGDVIRAAFGTVAETFGLREESCPTNGAFLRDAALFEEAAGTALYGAFEGEALTGVAALKRKDEALFSLEKLAVLPRARERGLGAPWRSIARGRRARPEGGGFPSGSCMKTAPSCAVRAGGFRACRHADLSPSAFRGLLHGARPDGIGLKQGRLRKERANDREKAFFSRVIERTVRD